MTDHARFQEILALRLYGEADAAELEALDLHLAGCAACRALGSELARGVGSLISASDPDPLPAGWAARLRESTLVRRRPSFRPGLVAAAAFAAGVLLTIAFLPPLPADPSSVAGDTPPAATPSAFARAAPPPPTSTRGFVSLAGAALAQLR